jgi:hypothetical protein
MSHLNRVPLPELASFKLAITSPASVAMTGTIAVQDPGLVLGPCIRALHEAALADQLAELRIDVRGLTFVNSSAIRLLVDWSTWVASAKGRAYVLCFCTDRRITWQRTSFAVLQSLAGKCVAIESV